MLDFNMTEVYMEKSHLLIIESVKSQKNIMIEKK